MTDHSIGQHISSRFDHELEDIRTKVLEMGGIVENQLDNALQSIADTNEDLAKNVIITDDRVNNMELDIDEQCIRIIAQRQPRASDLRLIIAVLRIIVDLERMGDESQRVARMAERLAKRHESAEKYPDLNHLGKYASNALHKALDAFARSDVDAAFAVLREDKEVDREYESILHQSNAFMMDDPRNIPHALDITWSTRSLERIGDRACNIAEHVIYIVKGENIRHAWPDDLESS